MAGTGDWQLYDLSADPGEIRDLAAERPEKLAELLAAWDRYVDEAGVLLGPNTIFEVDPAMFDPPGLQEG